MTEENTAEIPERSSLDKAWNSALLAEKIKKAKCHLKKMEDSSLEFRDEALKSEEEGDSESCWFFMALRKELTRSIDKFKITISKMEAVNASRKQ